jgi:predicted DNA-binding transcriptional regulator YafY
MRRVIERILNLLAFLLTAGRPVTAEEIRNTVAGYDQEGDEAFRRTFERDKDLLRHLGIPLQLQATDRWEVEHGYVVPPEQYALADPGLTDEERTALALAAQVVRLGGQAPEPGAIFKLGGAPLSGGEPLAADLGAEADTLPRVFTAVTERRLLRFRYRERDRLLRPYGLVYRRGHWYAVGAAGDEIRSFRVDRIDALRIGETPGAFTPPPGFRAADALPSAPWEAGDRPEPVRVRFDAEVAWWARRQLTADTAIADLPDGAIDAEIAVSNLDAFMGWMIGFEDQAEILAPPSVRERFVALLEESP